VESAVDVESNSYPVTVTVEGSAGSFPSEQRVICASAPFFKPRIDGNLDEWKDSIPVAFPAGGRKTVVRSYWNNDCFCLAVEVEEDKFIGLGDLAEKKAIDAVQFGLSLPGVPPADNKLSRYEFLVAGSGSRWSADKCFLLAGSGDDVSVVSKSRQLDGLEMKDAKVVVKRRGTVTCYEVAVPFSGMPAINPAPGREIGFGLIVHDPDGTGIRDIGSVMNRWETSRKPSGWCSWNGVKWGEKPPYDSMAEFGFCSSIH
jgi:hypothetical protein